MRDEWLEHMENRCGCVDEMSIEPEPDEDRLHAALEAAYSQLYVTTTGLVRE